jgi:hypothetical protein
MDKISQHEYKITGYFPYAAIIEFEPGLGVGVNFGMQSVLKLISTRYIF